MGKKLPGSPIVGYYNKESQDFEGHNRDIEITDENHLVIVDTTRPYGFVPTNAKVWFQKFNDEGVEHEYLVTECYIWTTAYPESKRILEQGNNQSMELDKNSDGFWANDDNSGQRFFIYSEALIEKLCVLGENVEPCFEGAGFSNQFSLEDNKEFQEFKATMFSMLTELQETLKKGGSQELMNEENKKNDTQVNENPNTEELDNVQPQDEFKCGGGANKPKKDETPNSNEEDNNDTETDDKKKKKKYNLDEVVEYAELKTQYEELQNKFNALEQDKNALDAEINSLKEFKLQAERKDKQAMIDSFYMLSDEDKKDVTENIDTYSLDDIEGKLSIICFRNKLNLSETSQQNTENQEEHKPDGSFSLNTLENTDDNIPAWVKAVAETAKNI